MSGPGFDLVPWMFHLLAAGLLGFGWQRLLRPPEHEGSRWRRLALFVGYFGASASFVMYLVEFFAEFRYSNRSFYDDFSGAAMIPLFVALATAVAGQGRGRVLLALATVLIFGLWLSITPMRLF
ncbi:MAG TPA: hypothetical protein VLE48_05745 [Terriglobales bacterium]|nr:hypothetical protein [Terriglobales bacterium]